MKTKLLLLASIFFFNFSTNVNDIENVFSQAKKMVVKQTKGFYPAPLKALDVIKKTIGCSNREKALALETEGFVEVGITDVSKNLINLFAR